jgi:hypothetical protein
MRALLAVEGEEEKRALMAFQTLTRYCTCDCGFGYAGVLLIYF